MFYQVGLSLAAIPGKLDIAHGIILAISGRLGRAKARAPLNDIPGVGNRYDAAAAPLSASPESALRSATMLDTQDVARPGEDASLLHVKVQSGQALRGNTTFTGGRRRKRRSGFRTACKSPTHDTEKDVEQIIAGFKPVLCGWGTTSGWAGALGSFSRRTPSSTCGWFAGSTRGRATAGEVCSWSSRQLHERLVPVARDRALPRGKPHQEDRR